MPQPQAPFFYNVREGKYSGNAYGQASKYYLPKINIIIAAHGALAVFPIGRFRVDALPHP